MKITAALSPEQLDRIRGVAAVLIPGASVSVPAPSLADFDDMVQCAAAALDGQSRALAAAIEAIPAEPSWQNLSAFADADPSSFEQVSLLAVGAYFMSPAVLDALGLPTGNRRPAKPEQVVDELSTGILDAVFERGCPVRTLDDVAGAARAD
ncbi:hypothetical protein AB0L57_20535 [Nocardia sp. NPDC052254]|uniref:hypothetical protein n=1 Tax=Nocardia sp. NPDC052254 TaxID=3155681 RepID=UPI00342FE0EF